MRIEEQFITVSDVADTRDINMIKTKPPTFEKEMKKIKDNKASELNEYKSAVVEMTQLMTNLIGAQRETLTMISNLGRMMLKINSQIDTMTTMAITKDQIIKPK